MDCTPENFFLANKLEQLIVTQKGLSLTSEIYEYLSVLNAHYNCITAHRYLLKANELKSKKYSEYHSCEVIKGNAGKKGRGFGIANQASILVHKESNVPTKSSNISSPNPFVISKLLGIYTRGLNLDLTIYYFDRLLELNWQPEYRDCVLLESFGLETAMSRNQFLSSRALPDFLKILSNPSPLPLPTSLFPSLSTSTSNSDSALSRLPSSFSMPSSPVLSSSLPLCQSSLSSQCLESMFQPNGIDLMGKYLHWISSQDCFVNLQSGATILETARLLNQYPEQMRNLFSKLKERYIGNRELGNASLNAYKNWYLQEKNERLEVDDQKFLLKRCQCQVQRTFKFNEHCKDDDTCFKEHTAFTDFTSDNIARQSFCLFDPKSNFYTSENSMTNEILKDCLLFGIEQTNNTPSFFYEQLYYWSFVDGRLKKCSDETRSQMYKVLSLSSSITKMHFHMSNALPV
eukprot:Awhi_evm1s14621